MSKQPPPAPIASTVGPCPTIIQIVGRPGTGSLPSTNAPPDHPLYDWKELYTLADLNHRHMKSYFGQTINCLEKRLKLLCCAYNNLCLHIFTTLISIFVPWIKLQMPMFETCSHRLTRLRYHHITAIVG